MLPNPINTMSLAFKQATDSMRLQNAAISKAMHDQQAWFDRVQCSAWIKLMKGFT